MGDWVNKTKIDYADYSWAKIPGFDNYRASSEGMILSLYGNKPWILKPITRKAGYKCVFLYQNGQCQKKYIHGLILLTFIGPPKKGQECRHLDGNPANNNLSNLRWGTKQENVLDKRRHCTMPEGEKAGTHKLTEDDVRDIRKLYRKTTLRELGRLFSISHTAIRRAAVGITWRCVKEGLKNG